MHTTLRDARFGFRLTKQTENKSAGTIEWYDSILERFEAFLSTREVDAGAVNVVALERIATDDVRQFISHLQGKQVIFENHQFRTPIQRPLSPYTIRGIVATLSAFFHWAVAEELITKNPMDPIHRPRVPRSIKERFSEDDINKLLAACAQFNEALALRNRAILLFLLDTGVRAGELVGLTRDRLDLEHRLAHVTGKGQKDREVYYGTGTSKALWSYSRVRPDTVNSEVFVTREGEPITVDRLQKVLRDLGERAGVAHCHPHRFRHTAARLMLRNGIGEFALQRVLGHEDMRTTQIYAQLEREDVEKAHARSSPVDRWGLK